MGSKERGEKVITVVDVLVSVALSVAEVVVAVVEVLVELALSVLVEVVALLVVLSPMASHKTSYSEVLSSSLA